MMFDSLGKFSSYDSLGSCVGDSDSRGSFLGDPNSRGSFLKLSCLLTR